MKAITFLGTGRYSETTYEFSGRVATPTNLFPAVVCELFEPSELVVLVTEKAREMWLGKLESEVLRFGIRVKPIDIPDGHRIEDLWDIFAKITDVISEGDEVVFDITHSFRTLPFLSFLAASYLSTVKNAKIRGVYYGAFEARDPQPPADRPFDSSPTDRSPIFDLTPFVQLLEWTSAADHFIKSGDAGPLSDLIQPNQIREFQELKDSISDIATGLDTLRPLSVMEAAYTLKSNVASANKASFESLPQLKPIVKKIEEEYGQFAVPIPKDESRIIETRRLMNQLRMVDWYRKRGRWLQAISLARESIVTLACYVLQIDPLNKDNRKDAGDLLGDFHSKARSVPFKHKWSTCLESSVRDRLHCLWGGSQNRQKFRIPYSSPDLTNLRNDMMHAGQLRTSGAVDQTIEDANRVLSEFQRVVGEILSDINERSRRSPNLKNQ